MALSEQEQRLLDEMERHLYQNDADVMSTAPRQSSHVSTRAIVLAILAVAVGLGIVIAGLATQLPIVGVLGFVVMLVGVLYAFRGSKRDAAESADTDSPASSSGGSAARGGAAGKRSKSGGGFMDRLEDRWDRRRGE